MGLKKGLWQLYVGKGKGKTTAAFGLALRAIGQSFKVCVIQFMKVTGPESGEVKAAKSVPGLEVLRFGSNFLGENPPSREEVKKDINEGIDLAREVLSGQKYDVVILDEILTAWEHNLVTENRLLELAKGRTSGVELVMTGQNAPANLIKAADLVTEMRELRHPFKKGVKARRGIEY